MPSVQDAKLEAQIVALTAKLEYFKANKSLKEVKNDKREKARKAKLSKKWAWKLVPPKEDDPKTKTVDTKEYHWCSNHASWTVHTAKECNMSPQGMSPPVKIPKTNLPRPSPSLLPWPASWREMMMMILIKVERICQLPARKVAGE